MNTFAFTLDLSKSAYMEPLRIRQGDHNGTTVQATILDHGVALDGSYTARFCMRHPGTGATYYRETGTYANGVATIALDEQYAASVPGRTTAYIQLLQGSTVIASTSDIPVVILRDATEDAVPGEVYDSAIEDALAELDEATGRISIMVQEQVAEELAAHPEWTTTVQDNSLPDSKLIQSGGILSRNARLMYRLANLLTHRTDEGTLAAISDAAKTPMAGLSIYGQSTQDGTPTPESPVPIVSVEGDSEGNISLRAQGRNLYRQTVRADGSSETVNGATFTYVGENSMAVSGSPTSNTWKPMSSTETNAGYYVTLPAGTYTASKGTTLGRIYVRKLENGAQAAIGNSAATSYTFTLTEPTQVAVTFAAQASETYDNTLVHLQIEVGDTAHAYEPYTETVTPIDLDGHELRSLPDGTRDELTVDAEGHVTLVQRVGSRTTHNVSNVTDNGDGTVSFVAIGNSIIGARSALSNIAVQNSSDNTNKIAFSASGNLLMRLSSSIVGTKASDVKAWLDEHGAEILYALATPVTYDLGTVPLVPLVGPDLTAQTVPTAPFVLDAERDLNTTLARLEAAIAALA